MPQVIAFGNEWGGEKDCRRRPELQCVCTYCRRGEYDDPHPVKAKCWTIYTEDGVMHWCVHRTWRREQERWWAKHRNDKSASRGRGRSPPGRTLLERGRSEGERNTGPPASGSNTGPRGSSSGKRSTGQPAAKAAPDRNRTVTPEEVRGSRGEKRVPEHRMAEDEPAASSDIRYRPERMCPLVIRLC